MIHFCDRDDSNAFECLERRCVFETDEEENENDDVFESRTKTGQPSPFTRKCDSMFAKKYKSSSNEESVDVFRDGIAISSELIEDDDLNSKDREKEEDEFAKPPSQTLCPTWIHGSDSQNYGSTVMYTGPREIVYTAGCAVVIMKGHFSQKEVSRQRALRREGRRVLRPRSSSWHRRTQRIMTEHSGRVLCVALHTSTLDCVDMMEDCENTTIDTLRLVATGERSSIPKILVWDLDYLKVRMVLQGFHRHGVSQLSFCKSGELLCSSGEDCDHSIAVYDWQRGEILCHVKGGLKPIHGLVFNPDTSGFIQVGLDHAVLHSMSGTHVVSRKVLLGAKGRCQRFLCVAFVGTTAVMGTS